MKIFTVIIFCCLTLLLVACGDDASAPETEPLATSDNVTWKQVKDQIVDPQGPVPAEVVVKDLAEGTGRGAKDGDELSVRYINFDYNTGRSYEARWKPPRPFLYELGSGEALDAWETGLRGMKAKGRRAIIVPAKDAYGNVPQVYILELQSIE